MADQHLTQDQLVDLALDDVEAREPLLRHLAACPRCRGEYDEMTAVVDHTLMAAPQIEPSPGFDHTVLSAMGMTRRGSAGRLSDGVRRRPWLIAAAAAVIGVLAGAGATVAVVQPDGTDQSGGNGEPAVLANGSALRTSDGEQVGSITRSFAGGEPVIVVGVTQGPVGVHYECRLQMADGTQRTVGDWVLESEEGATWIVQAPPSGVEAVQLVTDSGAVWSSAPL